MEEKNSSVWKIYRHLEFDAHKNAPCLLAVTVEYIETQD